MIEWFAPRFKTSGSWTDSVSNAHSLAAWVQNCTGWLLKPFQQELATASLNDHTHGRLLQKAGRGSIWKKGLEHQLCQMMTAVATLCCLTNIHGSINHNSQKVKTNNMTFYYGQPSTNNHIRYTHTVEKSLDIKRDEVLVYAT